MAGRRPARRPILAAVRLLVFAWLCSPRFCCASDDALALSLRDGDLSERVRAVNQLGQAGAADDAMLMALGDPDWQVRLQAVHWVGRRGLAQRPALDALLESEDCPLVRMSALYWLAEMGGEPEKFQTLSSSEDMRGCESWVGPIARGYPRVPGKKTGLALSTPPDARGCFYARLKRRGKAACPGGAVVAGMGTSPGNVELLADESTAGGVALCCPPGKGLFSDVTPRPAPRETGCHLMAEKCPVGWVEAGPQDRRPTQHPDTSWVDCCPQAEPFQPLPPQPSESIPVCPWKGAPVDWLALGIEGVDGCDPGDPNCAIKAPEDTPEPQVPLVEAPRKAAPRPPAPRSKKKPLPKLDLVQGGGKDPGEVTAPVASLLSRLKSSSAKERERSALALAGLGPQAAAAVPALIPALKSDPDPRVRACAALALASITKGSDHAIPFLRGALDDPHPGVRSSAVQALGKIGTPKALAAFLVYSRIEATRLMPPAPRP